MGDCVWEGPEAPRGVFWPLPFFVGPLAYKPCLPMWKLVLATVAVACATQVQRQPLEETRPATQSAAARAEAELRRSVEALVEAVERPPGEGDFKKLGPGALAVLEQ